MSIDLEAEFRRYFSGMMDSQVALWIIANDEMSLALVNSYISKFNKQLLKKEFLEKQSTFDYRQFRLIPPSEEQSQLVFFEGDDLAKLKQILTNALERLGNEERSDQLSGNIFKQVKDYQKDAKIRQIKSHHKIISEQVPKTQYLQALIQKIIDKYNKNCQCGIAEKIINYGGIEPVITELIFAQDITFRQKFTGILYNCNTFKELRKYGGQDIKHKRMELTDTIIKCLTKLELNADIIEEVLDELIKQPLSSIVADREDLTNKQKQQYYQSQFYKSGCLKDYAQVTFYENSLQSLAKDQITQIIKFIEVHGKLTKEIVDNVVNFKLYELLRISSVRYYKKSLFEMIVRDCPNYYTAFKLVKYQKKDPASLRQNEILNIKMKLVDVFFKIKLPFEEWKIGQDRIMNRDYKFIDDLTLKQQSKHKLMDHILQNIEPFFHSQDKKMNYRSEIQLIILEELMKTETAEQTFQRIILIIKQTLDSDNFTSDTVTQLAKWDQTAYNDVIQKNQQFRQYVSNKRRDIKEELYQKSWQFKKKIYDINLQQRIDVSYESIDNFLEKVIADGGRIPKSHPQYITNLPKLNGEPIQPIVEDDLVSQQSDRMGSIGPSSLTKLQKNLSAQEREELANRLTAIAEDIVTNYIRKNNYSIFEKCYDEKFHKNAVNFITRIIETDAFNSDTSPFFAEAGFNNTLTSKMKAEFGKNAESVSSNLSECISILKRLNRVEAPLELSPELAKKTDFQKLQKEFKECAIEFANQYQKKNESSRFVNTLNEKYNKDTAKFIRDIIQYNAFQNQESQFFTKLNLAKVFAKRMKNQFNSNAEFALNGLKRCKEIIDIQNGSL